MLNNKKDNRFLDALNNIDDDLVDEVTDDSVRSRRVERIQKRSWLGRAAVGAASLAAMAAVCIGVITLIQNLPSTPPGEETSVVSETTPSPVIRHTFVDELLEEEKWRNIDSYVNAADEEEYYLISNFEELKEPDPPGTTVGAVFDRVETFGGNELALLGFNAYRCESEYDEHRVPDTVFVGELRIALVKSGRITATLGLYDLLSDDNDCYILDKKYFDKYLDMYGDIAIFRDLFNCRIPKVSFFSVNENDNTLMQYIKSGVSEGAVGDDDPDVLSPVISGCMTDVMITDGNFTVFALDDELTGTEYCFLGDTYIVRQKTPLYTGFKPFDYDSIPVMQNDLHYEDFEDLAAAFAHNMILSERKLGEYTLCLVGNNFWRTESGIIYFYDPQIIIKRGDEALASVPGKLAWFWPYYCSEFSYNDDLEERLSNAFIFGDDLFIFHGDLEDIERIWCFDGENLYTPERSIDNTLGEAPFWTISLRWHDLKVDEERLNIIYGFREFWFEIGKNGEYEYRVEWAETPSDLIG